MFETRIQLIQDSLTSCEIDALLITSSYNIAYLTGIHAFSIEEREARMLVTRKKAFLFTDARYSQMTKGLSFISLCEISSSSPYLKQFKDILAKNEIKKVGFEEENITYKEAADLEEALKTELIPTCDIVEEARQTKDNDETRKVRQACALTDKGFGYILPFLKPGSIELEIKAKLENFIRLEGGDLAFGSIVAFGKNSAIPHHMSDNTKLLKNDIVLLDFGAKVNGYCPDMTRTVFVGQPESKMQDIYKATQEAQEVAIDYLKQHMTKDFAIKNVHAYANSHIKAVGFPAIPHAIGHGVGLQVHELPVLSPYGDDRLEPGMVVTVEPGIYLPDLGGVRIEDIILVTTDGLEILTKSSKKLTVL